MSQYYDKEILNEREVSRWLGISEPTLFRHRRDRYRTQFHSPERASGCLSQDRRRGMADKPHNSRRRQG